MKNKVEIKKFFGAEVRVVNNDYIVVKDMFRALGRVKEDGGWNHEKNKMLEYLDIIGLTNHSQNMGGVQTLMELDIKVKKGQVESV